MRPLILGHSNPHSDRPGALNPTDGTGRRLFEMSGMTLEDYQRAADRANWFDPPTPPDLGDGPVLVLGRAVWAALGLPVRSRWFETVGRFTLMPHPSGRSLVLNDPEMRLRFGEVMRCHISRQ